jgi:hypothetical protein
MCLPSAWSHGFIGFVFIAHAFRLAPDTFLTLEAMNTPSKKRRLPRRSASSRRRRGSTWSVKKRQASSLDDDDDDDNVDAKDEDKD